MSWTTAWSTIAALLLGAREVSAQQVPQAPQAAPSGLPTVELDYQVAAGLACPTAEQLRADVAKETHYDAFDTTATGVLGGRFHVVVSHGRPGFLLVRLNFDDVSGKPDWDTEFEGAPETARTCSHLVRQHVVSDIVMELTLLTARVVRDLPPRGTACPEPKPTPAPGPPPPPCPPVSPFSVWPSEWPMPPLRPLEPDPPKPPEKAPFAVRLGVSVWPELVATGWGSFGFSARSARATASFPSAWRRTATRRSAR
jgi:hypothetical protein